MPFRFTTDQYSVLLLGVISGVMALGISSMTEAPQAFTFTALPSAKAQEVIALPPPPEPARAAPSAIIMNQRAAVRVDDGTVKFFFPSGKTDVAQDARHALKDIVASTHKGEQRIHIAGFHDDIGDPEQNAALAQQRAFAVQKTLIELGVPASRIEVAKPAITTATASNAQARRVEVALAGGITAAIEQP